MPIGVEVDIEDDEATVAFVDRTRKGPGLNALLKVGGTENVRKVTLPREAYVVPVWVARDAGLTDDAPAPADVDETPVNDPNADDGLPDMDWSRDALNKYAADHGVDEPEKLSNKGTVLAAIKQAYEEWLAAEAVAKEDAPVLEALISAVETHDHNVGDPTFAVGGEVPLGTLPADVTVVSQP